MKAVWKNTVLAESNNTIRSQSNDYFPPESVKKEYLRKSETHTRIMDPYRGPATYYDIVIGKDINKDAAWYFTEAKGANRQVNLYVAFDQKKGVTIEK